MSALESGCFWGTEKFFKVDFPKKYPDGLIDNVRVGYMGPSSALANPTYRDVCTGTSQHVEVCEFTYAGGEETFAALCRHFFSFHDPTTLDRQGAAHPSSLPCSLFLYHSVANPMRACSLMLGNDVGSQYASVIFYRSDLQRQVAEQITEETQALVDASRMRYVLPRVVTQVLPATVFYEAEREHQGYLANHPGGYCNHFYRADDQKPPH